MHVAAHTTSVDVLSFCDSDEVHGTCAHEQSHGQIFVLSKLGCAAFRSSASLRRCVVCEHASAVTQHTPVSDALLKSGHNYSCIVQVQATMHEHQGAIEPHIILGCGSVHVRDATPCAMLCCAGCSLAVEGCVPVHAVIQRLSQSSTRGLVVAECKRCTAGCEGDPHRVLTSTCARVPRTGAGDAAVASAPRPDAG
jgi:hypothetical protein